MKIFSSIKKAILDFIFPVNVNEEKINSLDPAQFFNLVDKSLNISSSGKDIDSILSYRDPLVRALVWLIKWKRHEHSLDIAATIILEHIFEEIAEYISLHGNHKILLAPIPSNPKHLKEKGFNQVEVLAKKIIDLGGGEIFEMADVLEKKSGKSQTEVKNRRERLENARGSLSIKNPSLIKGRTILLLDDVTTTGATLLEARKVLRGSGAKKVIMLALSH